MILIIDNYDSFTHNLVQYAGALGNKIQVVRNDKVNIKEIKNLQPTHIIISPGPGCPKESGASIDIINHFAPQIPILGVCLGHQSIGHIYGGNVKKLQKPVHGKISEIYHNKQDIFLDIPSPFNAIRYHSLIVDNYNLPSELEITAKTKEGLIMGCQHKKYPLVRGIQFHPESLWTENGKKILENFLVKKARQNPVF